MTFLIWKPATKFCSLFNFRMVFEQIFFSFERIHTDREDICGLEFMVSHMRRALSINVSGSLLFSGLVIRAWSLFNCLRHYPQNFFHHSNDAQHETGRHVSLS